MKVAVLVAVAIVAFAAIGSAQIRPSCSMPQLWEARVISFDPNERVYHNHTSEYRAFARYSYDGVYQRKRIFEEARFGSSPSQRFDILELYSIKKAYVTNLGTRQCLIYDIRHPFIAHDIPANATFEGYETLGAYPDYVTLTQWVLPNATRGDVTGTRYLTYTSQGCVPVRDDYFSNATGFTYTEFSDVTVGLHDPNIFNPPTGCKPAPPPPAY
eukprot:m.221104 g.221104  ORF g.221104 m.221104 type:complete len:214 (-) comp15719_c0_seq1:122-763(-)